MTEFVFFHIPSGTLVVSDLIENFERHKLGAWVELALCRIGGVLDPSSPVVWSQPLLPPPLPPCPLHPHPGC